MKSILLIFLFIFSALQQEGNGANILGVYTMDIKSHYIIAQPLLKELAQSGHNVTVITSFKTKNLPTGYHEINIDVLKLDGKFSL